MKVEDRQVNVATGVDLHLLCWNMDALKRPFLLVHGLASNAQTWNAVAVELATAGHPVVAVDQRGHGHSSKPDDGYDFATMVSDLVSLIGSLGWNAPVVVGQSWGGNVVVELAATEHRIAGAIAVVDGGFIELAQRFDSWEECSSALAPTPSIGTPAATMERWMREAHPDWPETGIAGSMANFEVRSDGTVAPWLRLDRHMSILAALYEHRPSTLFPFISVPVLVVPADDGQSAWTHDKAVAVESAMEVLAFGRVHWFTPADHDIHAQHPIELAALLLAFSEEITQR